MPLLVCPNCALSFDDGSTWCSGCGHDLVPADVPAVAVLGLSRRHEVVLAARRINCVCYGEVLRFDPVAETMASVFQCGRDPERIDCVGCRVCTTCGDLRCSCGLLSISIGVGIKKGTIIETVPLRRSLL